MLNIFLMVMSLWAQPSTLEEYALDRTVKIIGRKANGEYSQGTGIFIGPNKILSEFHVTGGPDPVHVIPADDLSWYWAIVRSTDIARDFAILELQRPEKRNKWAVIRSSQWKVNKEFLVIGNPGERDYLTVRAKLIGSNMFRTPQGHIRAMLTLYGEGMGPGFSGAGVFNENGEVVGMIETCSTLQANVCSAITGDEILRYLREDKNKWKQ